LSSLNTLTAPLPSLESRFFQLGPVKRLERWLNVMPHPPLVVEIAPDHVAAAHWGHSRGSLDACAAEPLQVGSIMASPVENNVTQPDAVRSALRIVLNRVPDRGAPLALLIPDLVVRVFILPFDSLPRRAEEALPVIRWRLKKSVPFDVDDTVVSWMRQAGPQGNLEVVTAIARKSIVREYEEIVESLGGRNIIVLSSTMATLPLLEERGASLLARMSGKTLTTVVVSGPNLCVYRATDMLAEADLLDASTILEEIFPAVAYYQDTWGTQIDRARLSGFESKERELREILEHELKFPVASLGDSEAARTLNSPASDMLHQNLEALVGWMMNEGA
jgi:type IV pilus assembly protein PilM